MIHSVTLRKSDVPKYPNSGYNFSIPFEFSETSMQSMRDELRMFRNLASKGSNFFCFRSIQRPEILAEEWEGTVLGRHCNNGKILEGKYHYAFLF